MNILTTLLWRNPFKKRRIIQKPAPCSLILMADATTVEISHTISETVEKFRSHTLSCEDHDNKIQQERNDYIAVLRSELDILQAIIERCVIDALKTFPAETPCTLRTIADSLNLDIDAVERVMLQKTWYDTRSHAERKSNVICKGGHIETAPDMKTVLLEPTYYERKFHSHEFHSHEFQLVQLTIEGWIFVVSKYGYLYYKRIGVIKYES